MHVMRQREGCIAQMIKMIFLALGVAPAEGDIRWMNELRRVVALPDSLTVEELVMTRCE
jgi:hypothetical protein